jgi:hypothetical protein
MRLYVTLDRVEADRLAEAARRERRRPKDQAAYLIARALERDAEGSRRREPEDRPAEALR